VNDAKEPFARKIRGQQVRESIADYQLNQDRINGESKGQKQRIDKWLVKHQPAVILKARIVHAFLKREGVPIEETHIKDVKERDQANNKENDERRRQEEPCCPILAHTTILVLKAGEPG